MQTSTLVFALLIMILGVGLGLWLGISIGRSRQGKQDIVTERADALAVGALLAPAADALVRVEDQLRAIEIERTGSYAELREQIVGLHRTSAELGHQTRQLAGALRSPQIRGRWGELQLQRIVELAGMTEHCDFSTQVTVTGEDGQYRPDLVVRLSGGRHIPVDAKVPFNAWLQALNAESPNLPASQTSSADQQVTKYLKDHAKAVRHHVDQLSSKAYWRNFAPSPEFVVMFIPGEPLLDAALAHDPQLAEYAFSRNVVLATPSTLITLLKTVAFTWRQERFSANAEQIQQLARDLYSRLATMGSHLTKLGQSLERSVQAYNSSIASIESRVLVTARKLTDLGVSDAVLAELPQVEWTPRHPQASEFAAEPGSGMDREAELARVAAEMTPYPVRQGSTVARSDRAVSG